MATKPGKYPKNPLEPKEPMEEKPKKKPKKGWTMDNPELELYNHLVDHLEKAKPGAIKRGDSVRWNSSGGSARGKVTKVITSGEEQVPNSSFKITGTPEDPGALIRVYRPNSDGKYEATDTIVGHKVSTLTKIEAL